MIQWKNKRVAVVGLGISNIALIQFLVKAGAIVSGRDRKSAQQLGDHYQQLTDLGVELGLGEEYLRHLKQYDAVFLTPGIPKHMPEIQELMGVVPLLSEIALVLAYAQAKVFAITGSSGKTTTTTLVGEMLKASGCKTYVGGNIGVPLIEQIAEIPTDARIVLELSSFQLELLDLSPHGALVTNISENHLDVHLNMESYILAKKQIYRHQSASDICVFNFDDNLTKVMSNEAVGDTYFFSMHQKVPRGTYLHDGKLMYCDGDQSLTIIERDKLCVLGEHNVANMLAATLFAYLAGASWDAIRTVAREFTGVPHRLERVAEIAGIQFYNSSIATSPSRAIADINAFSQPIILIAGGYDKHLSFTKFAEEVCQKVKELILLGETASLIAKSIIEVNQPELVNVHYVKSLAEAVCLANSLASPGEVVLLAPACASFDMYANFGERGDHFRRLIQNLSSEEVR